MFAFENAFSFDVDAPFALRLSILRHAWINTFDVWTWSRLSFQHQPLELRSALSDVYT